MLDWAGMGRQQLTGSVMVVLGMVAASPSPAAINPTAVSSDFVEDDLSGSGLETSDGAAKRAQRRVGLRLRMRSDKDRAALLRLIADIPAIMGECFPECREDGAAAVIWPLVCGLYEDRPITVEALAAESALPPEMVERSLERMAASGLVVVASDAAQGTRRVLPTPALRQRGNAFVDRLYYAFDATVNAP